MDPPHLRAAEPRHGAGRDERFLLLFALANAGGVVAYVPLLTLLLPAKVAAAAPGAEVEWLALATLVGAVAASVSNLAFGWASDVVGSRRGWAAAGLCLTVASYALVHMAESPAAIVAAVGVYQLVLNMLLAPLAAWAAEAVPDRKKGLLGGLLGAGPLIGAVAGVAATVEALPGPWAQMALVALLIVLLTFPLLVRCRPGSRPDGQVPAAAAPRPSGARSDFALLWAARLFVQVAGNLLFGFLFFYFQSLPEPLGQSGVARLPALAFLVAFPVGLALGALSDRLGRRRPFLFGAALASAAGLAVMASSTAILSSAAGYLLFGCGSSVFLSLHAGYAMQLLPSPARRGRDLGILNLTNTLPAIIAPLLALWLVPGRGFGLLLALLAGLVLVAGFCILLVRRDAAR